MRCSVLLERDRRQFTLAWRIARAAVVVALLVTMGCHRNSGAGTSKLASAPTKQASTASAAIPSDKLDQIVAAFNRGVGLMEQIKPSEAVRDFDQVVRLAPQWTTGRVNLGIALLNSELPDRYTRAEQELDRALKSDPTNCHAHFALGMLLVHLARFDEAQSHFEQVLKVDPDDADSHYQLGMLLSERNPKEARRHLEITLANVPHHESACYALHSLLRRAGEADKAQQMLDRFQELKQSGSGVTAGMKYGEMGRYANVIRTIPAPAAKAAKSATSASPTFTDVAQRRGITVAAAGEAGWPLEEGSSASAGPGVAVADVDGDGDLDVFLPGVGADARGMLLLNEGGTFVAAEKSGIDASRAIGAYFGDYDRDGDPDLYLTCDGPNKLYRNDGHGHFDDVTAATGTAGADCRSLGAAWADADHDGDLDLFVCNGASTASDEAGDAPSALFRNNGDGTFTDVAAAAGIDTRDTGVTSVVFIDLDDDRDLDIVLLNGHSPNRVLRNDRLGRYADVSSQFAAICESCPTLGAVVGDVDRDGREDLLMLRGSQPPRLLRQSQPGRFTVDAPLRRQLASVGGAITAALVDVDLDGDLDMVLLGAGTSERSAHILLLNHGDGRFDPPIEWNVAAQPPSARGAVAADLEGDGGLELLVARANGRPELWHAPLPADARWLEVVAANTPGLKPGQPQPSIVGGRVEVMTGPRLQVATVSSSSGYLGSPPPRAHFGLGAVGKLDYARIVWPDAMLQSELEIAANQHWRVTKQAKKASSCPVLFSWDGQRFAFVTDVLGGGGLGFFLAPGTYAQPDPTEHVRIPPEHVRPRGSKYLLRLVEPLEEVTYLDRAELIVYDHPAECEVYPDERFGGPAPGASGRPLVVSQKLPPVSARDERGRDVLDRVRAADRRCVDVPADERFEGFAHDHWLEVDFGDNFDRRTAGGGWHLLLNGWVEYTYSHINYAASQAGLTLRPPSIEVPDGVGGWRVSVPDMGYPAGLPRAMTVDVSSLIHKGQTHLRIRTNMRIYWDQVVLARQADEPRLTTHVLPPSGAELRPLGYPREFSPDGAEPTIFDYQRIDRGLAYKNLSGSLTRLGDVTPLVRHIDDQLAIFARGEELALVFDAAGLPPPGEGRARTLVLSFAGYCKDMDLYTAWPDTVEPLPYRAMDNYPPAQPRAMDADYQEYLRSWNTRRVPAR